MSTILQLAPQNVWKHFYSLTRIPRPSGHMEKITEFLVNFGKRLGLESFVDEIGNVIIRKPATPGMENRKGVILQAHMDMVPQKNNDTVHDFTKDPIETYVDGEWVKAKGTTLGADNGLGVAAIMAVLEDKNLKHGPLEALITKDEETGMYGAFGLKPGTMKGEILLNLDSEDEGELYIGCAGGIDITATLEYKEEKTGDGLAARKITLKGLRGGHSGLEINQGRGNANKLLARIVHDLLIEFDSQLACFEGGNMRNAIPREAHAVLVFDPEDMDGLEDYIREYEAQLNAEYAPIESGITLKIEDVEVPAFVVPAEIQDNMISVLMACQNGVMRMIPTVPDTVETSSNLAIVVIAAGKADVRILARSSCDTMKDFLADSLSACFAMAGMKVELSGAYSGWQPNVDSPILHAMKLSYKQQFGVEPAVKVIHAGLECGIIGANCPGLDMISFGPTLRSPHSPDERALIPTVSKFYDFLVATLEQTPEK
ncbi:aminoacyl-histidine dipeptidase [Bacteroides helcogenes]|uniref:Cytosol non-specific dipeptidase n=1 Tax=Bacteroides helcogenes (strain ATCC 35417 / DSM 20613 / JCM 6297 / CCUG 15421 / P 36-108) TaxID=693979 RepID=E6STX3_BACT6|nr:aminoacyl-histidine dipeptidase [Bacteroides helcogenes]ADV43274.1 aminoacyl-histidine dipeptidase [Bacteroides helcogenes P 36-108]MDY5238614.1 aminoacyl-histidine dipeptidase [Bacteroides helcogenes]